MKTAMQELRNDILIEIKLGYISEHSACRIFNYIDAIYIEKEKEHIMMAYNDGFLNAGLKKWKTSTEYYNETYNHLHIATDGKVGLSNPNETTNNKITISETKKSIEGIGLNNKNK